MTIILNDCEYTVAELKGNVMCHGRGWGWERWEKKELKTLFSTVGVEKPKLKNHEVAICFEI